MENYWTDIEAGEKASIRQESTGSESDRETPEACRDVAIILKNWK